MPIQNAMVRHTIWLSFTSFLLRGISMVFQVWLSNRIGAQGIGLLQLITTVGILAATVGTAGVRVASMYLAAEERGKKRPGGIRQATACCLIYASMLSVLAGTVLFIGSHWIATRWICDVQAITPLRLFAVFLPISSLVAVLCGWFTACVKIRQLAIIEVCTQVITLTLAVLFLSFSGGSTAQCCCAIMLANGIGELLTLLVLFLVYRRNQRGIPLHFSRQMWGRLFKLTLPLAGSEILRSGLSTAEHLLIPKGLAESGADKKSALSAYGTIHGMVFPVMMFPATFLYALSDLLVPELARCNAIGSQNRIRYLTGRCLKSGFLFACIFSGMLFCAAAPFGQILYHSQAASTYLQLFAPLVLMLYLDAIVDAMLKGLGQQVASVRYNIITSSLDIVLLLVFLPRYGISGYFWSFTLTHALNFYLSITRLIKITGHTPDFLFCIKVLCCAGLCAGIGRSVLASFTTVIPTLVGCGAYLAALLILLILSGALDHSELHWIRQLLKQRSAPS